MSESWGESTLKEIGITTLGKERSQYNLNSRQNFNEPIVREEGTALASHSIHTDQLVLLQQNVPLLMSTSVATETNQLHWLMDGQYGIGKSPKSPRSHQILPTIFRQDCSNLFWVIIRYFFCGPIWIMPTSISKEYTRKENKQQVKEQANIRLFKRQPQLG